MLSREAPCRKKHRKSQQQREEFGQDGPQTARARGKALTLIWRELGHWDHEILDDLRGGWKVGHCQWKSKMIE